MCIRDSQGVTAIAAAHGGAAEVEYLRDAPATVNAPAQTGHALAVAQGISAAVDGDVTPVMVSEDFSDMLNARPGAFMFIGNGNSACLLYTSRCV